MPEQDGSPHQDDATPPSDAQPLPLPNDLLPSPTGRVTRSYSPTERAGLKWLAVRDGVSVTAKRYTVPLRTLEDWLRADGGLGAIRGWLEEITLTDFLRAERAIFEAVAERARWLAGDDLLLTFRKIVEARAGLAVQAAGGNGQPALAAAQASVTLKVEEKDGSVQVIELGAPPEEASDQG